MRITRFVKLKQPIQKRTFPNRFNRQQGNRTYLLCFFRFFFIVVRIMNIFEKFYTDAQKIIHKNSDTDYQEPLCRLLCSAVAAYDTQLEPLASDICMYWRSTHTTDTKDTAADWFYTVFCFFTDGFEADMDFSDRDWQELTMIIDSSAEDIDMPTVQTLMRVLVERGKLV